MNGSVVSQRLGAPFLQTTSRIRIQTGGERLASVSTCTTQESQLIDGNMVSLPKNLTSEFMLRIFFLILWLPDTKLVNG